MRSYCYFLFILELNSIETRLQCVGSDAYAWVHYREYFRLRLPTRRDNSHHTHMLLPTSLSLQQRWWQPSLGQGFRSPADDSRVSPNAARWRLDLFPIADWSRTDVDDQWRLYPQSRLSSHPRSASPTVNDLSCPRDDGRDGAVDHTEATLQHDWW